MRDKLFKQIIVYAVLIQPRQVAPCREAQLRVALWVVVRIQGPRIRRVIPPPRLQSNTAPSVIWALECSCCEAEDARPESHPFSLTPKAAGVEQGKK